MKVQILWASPAERRFGSGDIFTRDELVALGLNVDAMLATGEAQKVDAKCPHPPVHPELARSRAAAREAWIAEHGKPAPAPAARAKR